MCVLIYCYRIVECYNPGVDPRRGNKIGNSIRFHSIQFNSVLFNSIQFNRLCNHNNNNAINNNLKPWEPIIPGRLSSDHSMSTSIPPAHGRPMVCLWTAVGAWAVVFIACWLSPGWAVILLVTPVTVIL